MWLCVLRPPRPDAPYWRGRRLLAAIDAIVWPALWVALLAQAPHDLGIVGPTFGALAVWLGADRLRRALWANGRYFFTTGWVLRIATALLLVGVALQLFAFR